MVKKLKKAVKTYEQMERKILDLFRLVSDEPVISLPDGIKTLAILENKSNPDQSRKAQIQALAAITSLWTELTYTRAVLFPRLSKTLGGKK